jgi:hypothetical protein
MFSGAVGAWAGMSPALISFSDRGARTCQAWQVCEENRALVPVVSAVSI